METRHRPPLFLLINADRGLSPGPMSISSSSSADINPYPGLSSPVRSIPNTGQPPDEDNLGQLLESTPCLVALLTESLQLRDSLEVRSLLFIFWGRSQGSALSGMESSSESSACTTSTSSPSHCIKLWCIVDGMQQLA